MTASNTVKKRKLNNGGTEEQTSNEKAVDGKEEEHDGRDNGREGDNGSQITGQAEAISKITNVSHTIHKSIHNCHCLTNSFLLPLQSLSFLSIDL